MYQFLHDRGEIDTSLLIYTDFSGFLFYKNGEPRLLVGGVGENDYFSMRSGKRRSIQMSVAAMRSGVGTGSVLGWLEGQRLVAP